MTMNKTLGLMILGIGLLGLTAGCSFSSRAAASSTPPAHEPTVSQYGSWTVSQSVELAASVLQPAKMVFAAANAPTCVHLAGWREYRVGKDDTPELLALWFGTSVEELLNGNCLSDPISIVPDSVIYVPYTQQVASVQTVLPLGVSAFVADPMVVPPGGKVKLYWQGQGTVQSVRVGWIYNGLFVEQANQLPSSGMIELEVPADGRDHMTFLVSVSDGTHEVAAQTTVQVLCKESWFFAPVPANCPTPPLVTNFREQHFERGTIVYIPALGIHYVMVAGQEAVMVKDEFVPGMPPYDGQVQIPPGYSVPQGAIYYIWKNEGIRNALGFAISEAVEYPGMLQRTVNSLGEIVYFSASSGHVYRIGEGIVWGVIIPT